jgi:ferritin-like metal-binding protein YciE
MAWNPGPKVADCREISRKWGHEQVIVIALSAATGKIEMATYGETVALCSDAKRLGDAAYAAVLEAYANS